MTEYFHYRIIKNRTLAKDIYEIILQPVDQGIHHCAGQYTQIVLPSGEMRPYSIANAPHPDQHLELHIRYANLPFMDELFTEFNQNREIVITKANGKAIYPVQNKPHSLLFIAGGTGFAPCKAIIESALIHKPSSPGLNAKSSENCGDPAVKLRDDDTLDFCIDERDIPLHLLWVAKNIDELYYHPLALSWQKQFSHFHYTPFLKNPPPQWTGESGGMMEYVLQHYPDLSTTIIYVFGPESLVQHVQTFLRHHNICPQAIYSDY
ncbi:MAG: hypothetical protein KIT27_01190 [Legionellales bacterium]|nr:hypothetical protein [Legionellales bacterium]